MNIAEEFTSAVGTFRLLAVYTSVACGKMCRVVVFARHDVKREVMYRCTALAVGSYFIAYFV